LYFFRLKCDRTNFGAVKKRLPALLFFIIGPFLYLTKAQTLKFTDSKHQPVEGIVVSIKTVGSESNAVLITDNKGIIQPVQQVPYIIQTSHFAYNSIVDTIYNSSQPKEFVLVSNNINLDEVTVTGNYSISDRSIYQTEVISKQQIESQAASNLQDLFTHQLNVRISNDASTGSSLTLQGIGGENIKILVDGVPVIGRLYNNINLSQLNLNNIERVEVIKGPASVLYGTNALGGVINLITDASTNPPFKWGVNTYYESTGKYNVDGFLNMHFKKSDISLNGGRNYFDGWSEVDTGRADEWKPKEQYFGSIKLSHKIKNTKFAFQSSFFTEKVISRSGDIQGWPYEASVLDVYFNTERINNEMSLSHLYDASHQLKITAAYSFYRYFRSTEIKDLVHLTQHLSDDPSLNDTTDFGSTMVRAVYTKDKQDAKINYQLGLDLNNEYTTGERIVLQKQETGDYAAFASMEYHPFKKLLVRPSVRYAYNTAYKAPVVPSMQFMYDWNKNTVLRLSYSRGFRSPSLKELYLKFKDSNHDVYGNINLKPEESDNYQFSADRSFSIGKMQVKVSPALFYNQIKNKISLAAQGNIYTYLNFYEYVSKGAQLTGSVELGSFEFSSGYAYTGIYNSDIEGNGYLYSSELNSMIQYRIPKSKTLVGVFWKYNGRLPEYIVDETGDVKVFDGESYSMVDASLTQNFFANRLTIGTGIKNIFDVTTIKDLQPSGAHQSSNDYVYTGMGRSYFVRLQYQLSR
jgi:outer membrane receptor for ferrienterochelin and colicins